MLNNSVASKSNSTITNETTQDTSVFAVLLLDGRICLGSAKKAGRTIAALNSGKYPAVPKSLQVYKILAVKDITETRTLPTVTQRFCAKYGADNVVVI